MIVNETVSFTGMHITFKDSFGGFKGIVGMRDDGINGKSDIYFIKGLGARVFIKLMHEWIRWAGIKDKMHQVVIERDSGNYKMVATLKKPCNN
jgi:hypothetical protein